MGLVTVVMARRNLLVSLVLLFCGSLGCVLSPYQGAVIDARDFMKQRLYKSALDELDRAKSTGPLTDDQAAEVAKLETKCQRAQQDRRRIALRSDDLAVR